ncbi:VCBS domain-containing protein, partial [Sulfurimonas sp.]|uniref:beta strand repeat-containing protein n=1 Tax=Sulfurimonas sp. TaxID=2022749 RepID=UPI002616984B
AGVTAVNAGATLPAVSLTATDSSGASATDSDTPTYTPQNDTPTIDVTAAGAFNENSATTSTVVATFSASDEEGTPTVTFTTGTNTEGYYTISGTNVLLTTAGVTAVNAGATLPAVSLTATDSSGASATDSDTPTYTPQNDTPTSTNDSITILEDMNNTTNVYTLASSDFGTYSDEETTAFSEVKIETLPTNGVLYLDGTAISAGVTISKADIDAGKLTFNPTDNSDADSSFGFKVSDGTNWSASSYTTAINITAVADAPTLTLTHALATAQEINIGNVTSTSNGFTVSAYSVDGTASTISINNTPSGFGVTGAASGDDSELGINATGSEKIVVSFDQDISSVDVSFAWKSSSEDASYTFYKDGVVVGTGTSIGGSDGIDPAVTLKPDNNSLFDTIIFSAPSSDDDYLIHSIAYEKVDYVTGSVETEDNSSVSLHITSALTDSSESLMVEIKDIPIGFSITDGTNTFTANASTSSINVTTWNLDNLTLSIPNIAATTTYTLNVVATSTEGSNGDAASTTVPFEIKVNDNPNYVSLNPDTGDVYESAMSSGTNSSSTAEIVTGNILANDTLGGNVTLTSVNGVTATSGMINITTAEGNTLVVNAATGDYTYTLINAMNHVQYIPTGNTITLTTTSGEVADNTFTGSSKDGWTQSRVLDNSSDRLVIDGNGDTATKTFDFGSVYANKTVEVSFSATANSNWGDWSDTGDDFIVTVNGTQQPAYEFDTNETLNYKFDITLDTQGKAVFVLQNSSDNNNEDIYIDNFKIQGPEYTTQPLDTVVDNFTYVVTDGNGTSYSSNLAITIHDDAPTSANASHNIYVGVDTISIKNLQAGWVNDTYANGTSTVIRTNTDSDSYNDKIEWGTPASGSGKSGYVLVDNSAFTGSSATTIQAGQSIKIADFTHNNFPINGDSSTLDYVDMVMSADIIINGVVTTVNFNVRLDHTETPNSSDPVASRDIITLPAQNVSVQIGTQNYNIRLDGFKDSSGNIVNTIYTDESAANSFEVMGSVTTAEPLPVISGTVSSEDGADGANIVWGDTASSYGTFVGNADGSYSFTLNEATQGSMAVGEVKTATFNYSVTDADGDVSSSSVTIKIGGYNNIEGSSSAETLNGTANDDMLTGYGGADTLNGEDGNDVLVFDSTDISVNGGVGYDTLLVEASIDFSALNTDIQNIEEINLGNGTQNITLTLADVIAVTDTDNDIFITGDSSDSVSLQTSDAWTKSATQSQVGFDEYTSTQDATVKLQIQDDLTVSHS